MLPNFYTIIKEKKKVVGDEAAVCVLGTVDHRYDLFEPSVETLAFLPVETLAFLLTRAELFFIV